MKKIDYQKCNFYDCILFVFAIVMVASFVMTFFSNIVCISMILGIFIGNIKSRISFCSVFLLF